jgi:FMN phosphatase YigB (HAD superfamily)
MQTNKPLYIFDLDGTLCDCHHRLHHIEKEEKNWNDFYKACRVDVANKSVLAVLDSLIKSNVEIWFWTGRSDICVEETIEWLEDVLPEKFFIQGNIELNKNLRMRKDGDWRKDYEIKESWLLSLSENDRNRLFGVFEDRKSVVDMWRKNNVFCFQVAEGDF